MVQKSESFGVVCPQGEKLSSEAELKIGYHHKMVGVAGLPLNETAKKTSRWKYTRRGKPPSRGVKEKKREKQVAESAEIKALDAREEKFTSRSFRLLSLEVSLTFPGGQSWDLRVYDVYLSIPSW